MATNLVPEMPQPMPEPARPQLVSVAPHEESLAEAVDAEKQMVHRMLVSTLVGIPVLVAFWVGLIAIAISFTDIGYRVPLAMAAGVGVLAGLFWGAWMGFVSYSHAQEKQRRAERRALGIQRGA